MESASFYSVGAVRTLRKWLADPDVPDELREGDQELHDALVTYLKQRDPNDFPLVTREEMEAMRRRPGEMLH